MTQVFKGDSVELEMTAAGEPPFVATAESLAEYFEDCYSSDDFLLMLYDEGRMPFSDRVPRDAFVAFLREAIPNFKYTGTFEAYLFIVKAIFGAESEILFTVPDAGKLEMNINTPAALSFDWVAREFTGGTYVFYEMQTSDNEGLQFTGISGIDSEYELSQLLAELIPAGIYPDISLAFYRVSLFIAEESGDFYSMLDSDNNQIIFFELGDA